MENGCEYNISFLLFNIWDSQFVDNLVFANSVAIFRKFDFKLNKSFTKLDSELIKYRMTYHIHISIEFIKCISYNITYVP